MKISHIKEKLDELLGFSPSQKESNKKRVKSINKLIQLLKEKEHKLQEKLNATDNSDDIQKYKRKLKLITKQLAKADSYKQEIDEP